jgi:hypothetical protein
MSDKEVIAKQRILDISGLDARSLYPLIDLLIVRDCQLRGAVKYCHLA